MRELTYIVYKSENKKWVKCGTTTIYESLQLFCDAYGKIKVHCIEDGRDYVLYPKDSEELISLKKYAEMHNVDPATVRQKVLRGGFKTAKKLGRNWVIDKNEPYIDLRKTTKTVNERTYEREKTK